MGPARRNADPDPHRWELEAAVDRRGPGVSLGRPSDPLLLPNAPGSDTDAALIPFLRDLKRHFPQQRVLLIWDGLSGHTSRVMTAYLARQRAWLTVERLPGYAPDLNPVEQLWGNVKTRELANVCAPSLAALRPPLHAGFARVRRQPHLAFAFLRHAGLEF